MVHVAFFKRARECLRLGAPIPPGPASGPPFDLLFFNVDFSRRLVGDEGGYPQVLRCK